MSSTDQALPHFPLKTEVKNDTLRSEDAPRGSIKVSQEEDPISFADNSLLLVWRQ